MKRPVHRPAVLLGFVAVLALGAAATFLMSRRGDAAIEKRWRSKTEHHVTTVLGELGERLTRLEDLALSAEKRAAEVARSRLSDVDPLDVRMEAFRFLGEEAARLNRSDDLPNGTRIGIQLFDASGQRLAWAGWPHQFDELDRALLAADRPLTYVRRVSLYGMLTRMATVETSNGHRWRLVVDLPLEVNYRVNNRFLQRASVAEDLIGDMTASARFDYQPPAFPSRQRPGAKEPAREPATEDRIGGVELPGSVKFTGFAGDETSGLNGHAQMMSREGTPLLSVAVQGRPFLHYASEYRNRFEFAAATLSVLALIVLIGLSMRYFPARFAGPLGSIKALYLVAAFVLVRYLLLAFPADVFLPRAKIFDAAIFATPALGGLMRSAGDLLITALFFVTALYGVLKITRESTERDATQARTAIAWLFVPKALVTAAVLLLVVELTERFIRSVVVNANPRLLGETMRISEPQVIILHLSTFLMISGIMLAGTIGVWGVHRLRGAFNSGKSSALSAGLLIVAAILLWRWEVGFISLLLLLFILFAPRIVQREDLVSIVLVAFSFVVIVSAAVYVFLNNEYQGLRRTFIQEKVTELTHPSDNWKVFVLEDVMEKYSQDSSLRQKITTDANRQRLAFDLWAQSSLSLLGYTSAVYVFDKTDSLVSQFSVEMPYRPRLSGGERMETASAQEWVVLDLTKDTAQGIVRFYRGIVNISDYVAGEDGRPTRATIGKIVVDVPFFFENLTWAARTGPRTPEVLRNVQEGGIAPRLEETEAILLARLRRTRVLETSSDVLPVGFSLPAAAIDRAAVLEWPLLQTNGPTYRYLVRESNEPGNYLLAGFAVPSPLQHLLRWSTILSLYFVYTVAVLVLIILLKGVPAVRPLLPTLTPGRQFGFQQKLLGSFLLIALLPAVILGVFAVQVITDRFVKENQQEALAKAFNAAKAMSNVLTGELNYLFDHFDASALFERRVPAHFSDDSKHIIRVLPVTPNGPGEAGASDAQESDAVLTPELADALRKFPPEVVFIHWFGQHPYLGVVSNPLSVVFDGTQETFLIYYARMLDGELLAAIADEVGADVNIYDGGELIASSREGLLSGGFVSAMMDASAFVKVSLMDINQSLVSEKAGNYRYEMAYLPVPRLSPDENASLGLPLLFQPESVSGEVEKATSVVLSIFALLSAATLGLGLLLARGIFEPLKGLLEGTQRIARGDLSFKLPAKRRDEIGTVVTAFNDMTDELARSRATLEERRRYLEVILANVGTGVISTDSDDRLRAVNNAAERILGINASDVIGKTTSDLLAAGVAPEFFGLLASGVSSKRPFRSSEIEISRDGHPRTVRYMLTRLESEGQYLGTVNVFEDLTELINSKKLSAWVEMARQIAHEIKNPLTPIKLSTQFMVRAHQEESKDFDKIFEEGAGQIIRQVEVLRRIASEFSSFGRMQRLSVAAHHVIPRLEEIIAPYRQNASGIEVSLAYRDANVMAEVDPEALRKICTNLVENAMEAMPEGGRLSVSCGETTSNGQTMVKISFCDTGPGLNEDVKAKLFEPYFSTKTTGTGLGLAICRSLSREMGGDVDVANIEDGHGVEATLLLRKANAA